MPWSALIGLASIENASLPAWPAAMEIAAARLERGVQGIALAEVLAPGAGERGVRSSIPDLQYQPYVRSRFPPLAALSQMFRRPATSGVG